MGSAGDVHPFVGLGLLLLPAAAPGANPDGGTVLFLALPLRFGDNPHIKLLKEDKGVAIEVVVLQPDSEAVEVTAIKGKGADLAKGKYYVAQCRLTGKDGKSVDNALYFPRKVPE